MSQDALIFLHISKTGGTTLRSIIQKQYISKTIYDLDPSYFISDSKDYDRVFVERFLNLKNMPNAEKLKYRCFFNSRSYGLHEFLPQSVQYITMLRFPIDHYISSFYFAVNKTGHIRHDSVIQHNLTLDTYLDYFPADNLQTRRLSGCDPLDSKVDKHTPITNAEFEQAKHNLEHGITVLGLLEHYDESLLLMQQTFAWQDVRYVPKNVAPKRALIKDLAPKTRERLEDKLQYDIALYQFAQELFQEQIKRQGEQFQVALQTFRHHNKSYGQQMRGNNVLRRGLNKIIRGSKRLLSQD
jgi:Galactose-3-O-sulfotransferase